MSQTLLSPPQAPKVPAMDESLFNTPGRLLALLTVLCVGGVGMTAACHWVGWSLAWVFMAPVLERNPFGGG